MKTIERYEEINDIIQQDFVMLVAKSHSCSACETVYNTLEQNVPNISEIDTYAVYIDDMDKFRGDHVIFSVPTVLIFSNGKELLRESRYIDYHKVSRLISMYK